jgi:hypothetical protein
MIIGARLSAACFHSYSSSRIAASPGLYGFQAIEASNFPRTHTLLESTLASKGKKCKHGFFDKNVFQSTTLGAVDSDRDDTPPSMLYAVTSHRPNEKIRNVLQMSGCILGRSKVIFMSHILKILRYFDMRKCEIAYIDTGKRPENHTDEKPHFFFSFPSPRFRDPGSVQPRLQVSPQGGAPGQVRGDHGGDDGRPGIGQGAEVREEEMVKKKTHFFNQPPLSL